MGSDPNIEKFNMHLEKIIREASDLKLYLQTTSIVDEKEDNISAFRFNVSCNLTTVAVPNQSAATLYRRKPALPTAQRVRQMIEHRRRRQQHFWGDLFGEPAWDMILDLTLAQIENRRVSVTSLCIASGVAPTTALRWINTLINEGVFRRQDDEIDRRRTFVSLTDAGLLSVAKYFSDIHDSHK